MEASELKKIYRANNQNILTVERLFDSAKLMQNYIPQISNEQDRKVMTGQFAQVANAINSLMYGTINLSELLKDINVH